MNKKKKKYSGTSIYGNPKGDSFSRVIKRLREATGLTQKELASKLRVSERQVRRWEKRKYTVVFARIFQQFRALVNEYIEAWEGELADENCDWNIMATYGPELRPLVKRKNMHKKRMENTHKKIVDSGSEPALYLRYYRHSVTYLKCLGVVRELWQDKLAEIEEAVEKNRKKQSFSEVK